MERGNRMKMKARAVIFDTDGTLVDTLRRFYEVFAELLHRCCGKIIEWDEFLRGYVEDTLDDVVVKLTRADGVALHSFWLEFLRMYRNGNAKSRPIAGAPETIRRLKEMGVPVAVITSCIVPAEKLREELESFGIRGADVIVTGLDLIDELEGKHHFSKEGIFRLAVERLGVEAEDCVIVGDYWNDITDGKKVGAKTVAVLTGLMRRELLERYGPDAIIGSVGEIFEIVDFR